MTAIAMPDNPLLSAVRQFLATLPPSYYVYTTGRRLPYPAGDEPLLLEALKNHRPTQRADLKPIAEQLNVKAAYDLATFAVRMAIYSARQGESSALLTALPALVMDDDLVDYRDTLRDLSIIEDCAARIGLDASTAFGQVAGIASRARAGTIRNGYLSRTPDMRAIAVMGVTAIEDEDGLQYVK
jgi:hypothetical protein